MNELMFYRPEDGITIYVEVTDEVLESDSYLAAVILRQSANGFVWCPDLNV